MHPTAKKMSQLAGAGASHPAVRERAIRVHHRTRAGEALGPAIAAELSDLVYVPEAFEIVLPVDRTLAERGGDCDDLSACVGAVAGSLGYKTRWEIENGHVFPLVHDGGGWWKVDLAMRDIRRALGHPPPHGRMSANSVGLAQGLIFDPSRVGGTAGAQYVGAPTTGMAAADRMVTDYQAAQQSVAGVLPPGAWRIVDRGPAGTAIARNRADYDGGQIVIWTVRAEGTGPTARTVQQITRPPTYPHRGPTPAELGAIGTSPGFEEAIALTYQPYSIPEQRFDQVIPPPPAPPPPPKQSGWGWLVWLIPAGVVAGIAASRGR